MTTGEEIISQLKAIDDSGVPLFTKERILEAHAALKKSSRPGQKVRIQGLDGKFCQFVIKTGTTSSADDVSDGLCWSEEETESDPEEYILEEPIITYMSIEELIRDAKLYSNASICYCNIRVSHPRLLRNSITKEPVYRSLSLEATQEAFQRCRQLWTASKVCQQLISTLESIRTPYISKIVAFACGRIRSPPRDVFDFYSGYQHALILTLRDTLCSKTRGRDIKCYAQDPDYAEVDKTVLEKSGIRVVDSPDGFFEVDASSMVLSICPSIPIKQIVLDLARPAFILWNRVEVEAENLPRCDPNSRRVISWINDFYQAIEFPGNMIQFCDVVMYVRKPASTLKRKREISQ